MPGQWTYPQGHPKAQATADREMLALSQYSPHRPLCTPASHGRGVTRQQSGKVSLAGAPEHKWGNDLTGNKRFSRLLHQTLGAAREWLFGSPELGPVM